MTRTHLTGTSGGESDDDCSALFAEGGSAVDVAIAFAACQVVRAAGSWVSFAGILGMVVHDPATGRVHDLNAEYDTVAGEDDPLSIPAIDFSRGLFAEDAPLHRSGRTVLVPGFMAGAQAAHDRFGRLPWSRVLAPAIRLAEEGFAFTPGLVQAVRSRTRVLEHWPETRAVFQPGGRWLEAGEVFRQPDLAQTLAAVAEEGAAHMYTGAWAEAFVDVVRDGGGHLSMADMTAYQARWTDPLSLSLSGHVIHTHGQPATGGVALLEALHALDVAGFADRYRAPWEDPDALYLLTQLCRGYLLDALPADLRPPVADQLSRQGAERLWAAVEAATEPLMPQHLMAGPRHSDGLVAADAGGMVAAVTHSINCVNWGEFGRFVGGVSVPDSAAFQQAQIAAAGPGRRLPSPLEIGIVDGPDGSRLGFASIGAGLHHKTVSCLHHVIHRGMTPQAAQEVPSLGGLHHTAMDPSAGTPGAQAVEGGFDEAVLRAAERNGITFIEDEWMRGAWVAARVEPDGRAHGTPARVHTLRGVSY